MGGTLGRGFFTFFFFLFKRLRLRRRLLHRHRYRYISPYKSMAFMECGAGRGGDGSNRGAWFWWSVAKRRLKAAQMPRLGAKMM